ncbi:MAG: GNAT family N-acetyltransferase [Roseibium sp.]
MTVRIRVAAPSDETAISALLLKSYARLLQDSYDGEMLQKALPLITRARPELLNSGSYYVALAGDDEIVGAGGWTRQSPTERDEAPLSGHIRHFGTDPDEVRKGVGRSLMNRCLDAAASAGLNELQCYSTLNGEAFYAACGFRKVEPLDITLPGGVAFPSLRMVRRL